MSEEGGGVSFTSKKGGSGKVGPSALVGEESKTESTEEIAVAATTPTEEQSDPSTSEAQAPGGSIETGKREEAVEGPQAISETPSQSAAPSAIQAESPARSVATAVTQEPFSAEAPHQQVIAVSASKGPAAFFNLARKFLATDEMCDLSALEGAIVSAVDAAHLLERSKLATIVRW
eukprot:CAMPEP_0195509646 /NCGR_PEP_ID=MMETSP0794_2-20130614/2523_1 /TAXON_ID=515487 /ORGANISM="Stephanopyxis turris, Strain CCMP 815" /LENGTH=175 /DNA_ID=CAMNT_0040636923 /DNA_START=485 /DNA_END=1009 /DNA_ORIENTATION=-